VEATASTIMLSWDMISYIPLLGIEKWLPAWWEGTWASILIPPIAAISALKPNTYLW
jgi:hypothetical protein